MKKNIIYLLSSLLFLPTLMACSDFLDENPDLRTTVDTEEKVGAILGGAYIYENGNYALLAEMASDNVVDQGTTSSSYTYSDAFTDRYYWAENPNKDHDSSDKVWSNHYLAIAHANMALNAIEELGGEKASATLAAYKGEALLCRAYCHWVLANLFCMPYYGDGSEESYLGIPYMETEETDLNPHYERGTLKEVYEKIEKDLLEGLPLIDDNVYTAPKYHFNYKAACAFASRFYLFTHDWDKTIYYANEALGGDPSLQLRDYSEFDGTTYWDNTSRLVFVSPSSKANYLLQAAISYCGYWPGPTSGYSTARYSHNQLICNYETLRANNPWGTITANSSYQIPEQVANYSSSTGKMIVARTYYTFQYTDLVAKTGYCRGVQVLFGMEEALLNRAEAYIMKGDYDSALADMNLYIGSIFTSSSVYTTMTLDVVRNWAKNVEYSELYVGPSNRQTLTPKKRFYAYPYCNIAEGSDQESMLQAVLCARRRRFMHEGMRWLDVRRYGITVYRYMLDADNTTVLEQIDKMSDEGGPNLRRAFQIPADVVNAGFEANPR